MEGRIKWKSTSQTTALVYQAGGLHSLMSFLIHISTSQYRYNGYTNAQQFSHGSMTFFVYYYSSAWQSVTFCHTSTFFLHFLPRKQNYLACFRNYQFHLTVIELRISLKCGYIKDYITCIGLKAVSYTHLTLPTKRIV